MNIKLNPIALKELRTVNPRLVSYNVEMTEVTGGTFWKAYTPGQIAGTEVFPPIAGMHEMAGKDGIRSKVMTLNGRDLVLGENDALPCLCGEPVSGKLELAPGSCAFIVL